MKTRSCHCVQRRAGAVANAICLLAWCAQACSASSAQRAQTSHPPAPTLRAGTEACSPTLSPLRRAQETEARATARMQSFAFSASDGVVALDLLAESQLCYRACGHQADAERVQQRQARWQRKLDTDYQGHQVRLAHALRTQRTPDAVAESRALLALLGSHDGAYTAWLRHVEKGEP